MEVICILGDWQRGLEKAADLEKRAPYDCFDLEKTYDIILIEIIWDVLQKKHVYKRYLCAIKDMYDEVKTSFRVPVKVYSFFSQRRN